MRPGVHPRRRPLRPPGWLAGLFRAGLGLLLAFPVTVAADPPSRPRILVETDAGGDPDDEQSLIRFLLLSSEWDVEGIIANRPETRPLENLNPERTGLGVVRRLVEAYARCHASLVRHDARFPDPARLRERVVPGYDDTEAGVRRILEAVDSPDPRPLWYSDWGSDRGSATNNLRRALDRVLRERGPHGYARFKNRLRLASADRFAGHTTTLDPPFVLWVDTWRPELEGRRWYHRFSALTATAGGFELGRDCLRGHGPLGALYPTNTTHPQKEGDSLSFLYLFPTGLGDPEDPTLGGWGGRLGRREDHPGKPYYWANQMDAWAGVTNRDNTLRRWAVALQNEFRARLDWCVAPPTGANHPPQVVLDGPARRTVRPGTSIPLHARAVDRDDQALRYQWELYREPGSYRGPVELRDADRAVASARAPDVAAPVELHFILTVTDSGEPALSRYARVIVTVEPPPASGR